MGDFEIEEYRGFVLVLDLLGVKTYTQTETREFLIPLLMELKKSCHFLMNGLINPLVPLFNLILGSSFGESSMYMFGDTLIVTWAVGNDRRAQMSILMWALVIREFIPVGFNLSLRIRGALAFGDFMVVRDEHGTSILGDAVNEAASWYEKADWIGIILTPKCGEVLEESFSIFATHGHEIGVSEEDLIKTLDGALVLYPVPLKGQKQKELWAIGWPRTFPDESIPDELHLDDSNWRTFFMKRLDLDVWPEHALSKRVNTLAFYEWYWKECHARK